MKKMFNLILASALALSLLTGCGSPAQSPVTPEAEPQTQTQPQTQTPSQQTQPIQVEEAVGVMLLSVNPEIEIEYDARGLVIELEGRNDDGRKIVAAYADFKGKSVEQVVSQLVERIYDNGYFQQEIAGQARNVVVKLEEGSAYPGDDFLEQVAQGVREAVERKNLASKPVTVDQKDLDSRGYIGLDKAKELVLTQLGLDEADFTQRDYELDHGVYELEFTSGGIEYEYDVDAVSGKVLKAERERDDDRPVSVEQPAQKPVREPAQKPASSEFVSKETAQANALSYLGLGKAAVLTDYDRDLEDGKYEFEFVQDGVEYDVDVDIRTGKVLRSQQERVDRDDDWDDRYDDDWDDRYDRDDWDD